MVVNTHLRNLSNKLVRQTRVLWLHKSDIQIIAIRRTNQVEKHKKTKTKISKVVQSTAYAICVLGRTFSKE